MNPHPTQKRVGPDGFALVGKPLQRLNEKEERSCLLETHLLLTDASQND